MPQQHDRQHRLSGTLAAVLAISSAIGLVGCVNQKKEVQTWRDVVDEGLKTPAPYVNGQPLSLTRAMALANHDNEQIGLSGENYLQAIINKNRAVANFLPTVSFQPSYTLEQRPSGNGSGNPPASGSVTPSVTAPAGFAGTGDAVHRFEAPVVGSMNIYQATAVPNLKAAEQTIIQYRQLLKDAQATLLLNVAQAYFQVLVSQQQVDVLQNSLRVQQARVRDVQGKFDNHLALALELSQAKAQAAGTSAELTQAQTDVQNGRATLALLINVPQVNGPLCNDVKVPAKLKPLVEYQQQAAATREDLRAAQTALKVARFQVDAAIAEYYPSVTLNVAGFLYRENFSDATKWDAILQGNLPIFSAGIIEADVRDAWSRLRQAALTESYLRRTIDHDVAVAYQNVVGTVARISDLAAQVQAAADALAQSQQQLDNGLAVPLDVLNAQDVLLNAQLNYTSTQLDRDVFYLDLLRASGQLTPQITQSWPTTRPATQPATAPSTR